jgi:hypothetical protein
MKHWIWDGYSPGAGYAFAESQKGLSPEQQRAILLGTPLDEPLPEVRVTAFSAGKLPDVMASAFYPLLVSDAVRKVVEEQVPEGVQYLPAKLEGKRAGTWWALNATGRVAAVDLKKSEYDTYAGSQDIRRVKRLVLKPVPADAPALFHLGEIPHVLVVSDAFRRAVEKAGDAVGVFQDPDEWRLGFFEDEE